MLSLASVPHSFEHLEYLPPQLAFLTSTDGSIIGDSVSPHTFTQHSFEDLQSLLLLPDFHTSTDGNTVSDSVSISGSGSGSGNEGQIIKTARMTHNNDKRNRQTPLTAGAPVSPEAQN